MNNLKSNIIRETYKPPFHGKYEELNSVSIPENKVIHNFQMKKIKEFSNINKNNNKFNDINELFKNGSINNLTSQYSQLQDQELNEVITELVNKISDFRQLTYYSKQKGNKNRYIQAQQKLEELNNFLTALKEKINVRSEIYENDLKQLQDLIKKNKLKSFNQAVMSDWIGRLNQIQGELVEEIGTAWLLEKIPQDLEILPISVGKIYYQGGKYGNAGQLVQDILTIDISNTNLLNNLQIMYKIGDKTVTTTLGNFLNKLNYYNEKEQIKIDDYLYEILLNLSVLNIQSKSGKNQLPWNKNLRTSFSINDFSDEANIGLTVKRTFQLLQSLYSEDQENRWIENTSKNYNALANYGLATVLNKVLSLSQFENQYLLTQSGFISYSKRLEEILDTEEKIIKIQGNVILSDGKTLSKTYNATV